MQRILLIGSQGQIGSELRQSLTGLGELTALNRQDLDLSESGAVSQAIAQIRPDVIINAAAYTAVDKAETEKELAFVVNTIAPKVMAESAAKLNAKLLHISTDYVFDGQQNTPYTEQDPPNPLGCYGQSKLAGEAHIRQNCDRHIILRTAWVYGVYGQGNFVKTMLRLGKEHETISVVYDQVGSPTWAKDIADFMVHLLQSDTVGTYHFTNSGLASWFDFAVAIFEEARKIGFPLKVEQVLPIPTSAYPTPAQRPAYSVLANQKITDLVKRVSPYWRHSLREMLQQLFQQR